MTIRPTIYTYLTALLLFCTALQADAQPAGPAIDFTSDTQGRLFIEKLIRQHNHNEQATQLIFRDVNARRPAALFILGDVVSLGYLNAKWKPVDANLKLLRANGIPVYGALGNHELMLNAAAGQKQFQARFPDHNPTGYTRVIDSVAILLLNSNFSKITPAQIQRQDAWYRQTLAQLNADPAIKLIIVGCHHSPYSNSTVVGSSLPVQQHFVPLFLQTKKCVLFLSGHSHNFEAFTISGKQFLVIGGGGGVHQPLNTSPRALPDSAAHYKPQFHYLQVTRRHDTLQLISRRLKPDLSGFQNGWSIMVAKVQ